MVAARPTNGSSKLGHRRSRRHPPFGCVQPHQARKPRVPRGSRTLGERRVETRKGFAMLSSHEVARWVICGHKHWEGRASARPRTMELQLQQVEVSKIVLASKLDVRWWCRAFSCLDGRLRQRSRSARDARFSCLMGLDAPEGWVAARMAMAELARAIRRSCRHHRREATNRPAPSVSCSAPQG